MSPPVIHIRVYQHTETGYWVAVYVNEVVGAERTQQELRRYLDKVTPKQFRNRVIEYHQ